MAKGRRLAMAFAVALTVHLSLVMLILHDKPRRPGPGPVIALELITLPRTDPAQMPGSVRHLHIETPSHNQAAITLPSAPIAAPPSPPAYAPTAATPAAAKPLAQALRFEQACQQARIMGRPLLPGCAAPAAHAPLGPRPVPEFAAAASAINRHNAYMAAPGSPDLWGTTHRTGSPGDRGDGLDSYGLYDGDPTKQRVFGQCSLTSSCTSDGHDPRGPDYHPGFVKWADPKNPDQIE